MHLPTLRHVVLIAGAGAGGLTVAALLKRARPDLDVAVVDIRQIKLYATIIAEQAGQPVLGPTLGT